MWGHAIIHSFKWSASIETIRHIKMFLKEQKASITLNKNRKFLPKFECKRNKRETGDVDAAYLIERMRNTKVAKTKNECK